MKAIPLLAFASIAMIATAGQSVGGTAGKGNVKTTWDRVKKKSTWYEVETATPKFSGAGKLGTFATTTIKAAATKEMNNWIRDSKPEEKPPNPYGFEWTTVVSIAKPTLISTHSSVYSYSGGAHPNVDFEFHTFGMVNGKAKKLVFTDLMKTKIAPKAIISDVVIPKLKAMGATSVTDGDMVQVPDEYLNNFVITPSGLTWMFAAYEAGSYAEGPYFVKVKWAELAPHLSSSGPLKGIML